MGTFYHPEVSQGGNYPWRQQGLNTSNLAISVAMGTGLPHATKLPQQRRRWTITCEVRVTEVSLTQHKNTEDVTRGTPPVCLWALMPIVTVVVKRKYASIYIKYHYTFKWELGISDIRNSQLSWPTSVGLSWITIHAAALQLFPRHVFHITSDLSETA